MAASAGERTKRGHSWISDISCAGKRAWLNLDIISPKCEEIGIPVYMTRMLLEYYAIRMLLDIRIY